MKFKATKSQFKNCVVYQVHYCALSDLLHDYEPVAYSCGVNGWACDYYDFGSIYICQGYRPIGKEIDYKTVKKFNDLAEATFNLPDDKAKIERKKLLDQFISEITKSK